MWTNMDHLATQQTIFTLVALLINYRNPQFILFNFCAFNRLIFAYKAPCAYLREFTWSENTNSAYNMTKMPNSDFGRFFLYILMNPLDIILIRDVEISSAFLQTPIFEGQPTYAYVTNIFLCFLLSSQESKTIYEIILE